MKDRPGIVLAVDVAPSRTSLAVVDAWTRGEVAKAKAATPANPKPEDLMDFLGAELESMLRGTRRSPSEILAVGCVVPGQVDDFGNVLSAATLGWTNVGLRDLLALRFDVPVWVEQDAKAAALGEAWRGSAVGMKNFVFVVLGASLGAGIVADGKVVRGAHHAAGEIGDLPAGEGVRGPGLASLLDLRHLRKKTRELGEDEITPAELFVRAVEDPRLRPIADEMAEHVARAVVAIGALLDPEAVVFGGATAVAGEALLTRVRPRIGGVLFRPPALLLSSLADDAPLHGALVGALDALGAELVRPRS